MLHLLHLMHPLPYRYCRLLGLRLRLNWGLNCRLPLRLAPNFKRNSNPILSRTRNHNLSRSLSLRLDRQINFRGGNGNGERRGIRTRASYSRGRRDRDFALTVYHGGVQVHRLLTQFIPKSYFVSEA